MSSLSSCILGGNRCNEELELDHQIRTLKRTPDGALALGVEGGAMRNNGHRGSDGGSRRKRKPAVAPIDPNPPARTLSAYAADAATIIEESSVKWGRFLSGWIGFNRLYNLQRANSERQRLIMAVESGLTDLQATRILASLTEAISYLVSLAPGDLRRQAVHPEFRAGAAADLQVVTDGDIADRTRLAHLLAVVYRVRCNLVHGGKLPGRQRDDALIDYGDMIVRVTLRVLIENARTESPVA